MYLEIVGAIVGLIYLWLEYRASIYLWAASIVMPAIYLFVYFDAGLYADFGINVYYLVAALYGWAVWMYHDRKATKEQEGTKQEKGLPITHIAGKYALPCGVVAVAAFGLIWWVLSTYTDSDVAVWDAFTTALSVIGMWMLSRKYLEQWLVWIVVDVASVGLYCYKGLFFTAALYGLYAIIAIFGYIKWKEMMYDARI